MHNHSTWCTTILLGTFGPARVETKVYVQFRPARHVCDESVLLEDIEECSPEHWLPLRTVTPKPEAGGQEGLSGGQEQEVRPRGERAWCWGGMGLGRASGLALLQRWVHVA